MSSHEFPGLNTSYRIRMLDAPGSVHEERSIFNPAPGPDVTPRLERQAKIRIDLDPYLSLHVLLRERPVASSVCVD